MSDCRCVYPDKCFCSQVEPEVAFVCPPLEPGCDPKTREAVGAVIKAASRLLADYDWNNPEPEEITPTPEEAEDWEPRYVFANEVKVGDYLIDMGTFQKVYSVRTFEPYDSVQIKAGPINYSKRRTNSVWILQKPEGD